VPRRAAAIAKGAQIPVVLAAIAIAVGVAACDRSPDRSASVQPELTPTTPAIAPPPANPPPVMPPPAATALPPSGSESTASPPEKATAEKGTPVDSVGAKADPAQAAQGSDPTAKQPMNKDEESIAMPKPAQANDHSTTATDAKQ
jgi:hypothetical protein